MIELNQITKVGFGAYRIGNLDKQGIASLSLAIDSGCTLIDTSSNYTSGESENIIGQVLNTKKANVFIVTKAGYINNSEKSIVSALSKQAQEELINSKSGSLHSINPEFLELRLTNSLMRLQQNKLDAFLLHSPEYYFEQNRHVTRNDFYKMIKSAFEFCEEQVLNGRIRYYGISSNNFIFQPHEFNAVNLLNIIEVAKSISINNHFKIVQFPFNLLEDWASKPYWKGMSLFQIAKENNLFTITNRPLNARNKNGGLTRLATYNEDIRQLEEKNLFLFDKVFNLINNQLKYIDFEGEISTILVIKTLIKNWKKFENPDKVNLFFRKDFYPFLQYIYESKIPEEHIKLFNEFHNICKLYARFNMTNTAKRLQSEIFKDTSKSFAVQSVEHYLNYGMNCVLVGMKQVRYVNEMKHFFDSI